MKVKIIPALILFTIFSNFLFAQVPTISYSSPQNYTVNTAISPLVPVSSKVSAAAYSSSTVSFGPQFSSVSAIAADLPGNVYTVDAANKAVKKIPVGGGAVTTIGSGFIQPFGLATDAAGNVYVLDAGNGTGTAKIYKVPANGGATVTIASGLVFPECITVDAAGNVYVSDAGVLKKVPGNGGAIVILPTPPIAPVGVAADASGNIYFTEPNYSKVFKVPAIGGTPVAVGSGFVQPQCVAVDASGNVFVTDNGNNTVTEIKAAGGDMVTIGSGFNQPYGVAAGAAGNIYISDNSNQRKEIRPVGGYYLTAPLPAGLNFSNGTGIISGTPTAVTPAIKYTITAYNANGSSTATVTLTVKAPSNNTALTTFTDNYDDTFTGALINGFWCDSTVVNSTINSLSFTAVTADPNATVTINGIALADGKSSPPFPLTVNAVTFFTLVVTAADGFTKETYPVTVKKGTSNNTALTSLLANNNTTLYGAEENGVWAISGTVGAGVTSLIFTPATANPYATVTINGTAVADNTASAAIALKASGATKITLIVTAADGVTKQTYPITITKSGLNAALESSMFLPGIFKTDSTALANNILTPNGDGVNDTWLIKNIENYPNNSVTVYDRMGRIVFAKKSYANDWAGTYGGSILNQGTYYYLVDLGNGTYLKGFITVVRDR